MSVSEQQTREKRATAMHRIFEIQDGLRQIHRLAGILGGRVQIDRDIARQRFGSDVELKATVSNYEAELFGTQDDEESYLPTYTAFQVLAQKLESFSRKRVIDFSTHPEDDWSGSFYANVKRAGESVSGNFALFNHGIIDIAAFWVRTNDMQLEFAKLLRFVYDWKTPRKGNTTTKELSHKQMIQDSAEWSELCEYCVWILTQVHCVACIGVYTDFMAERQKLNEELRGLVLQIAFYKKGLESTVETPATAGRSEDESDDDEDPPDSSARNAHGIQFSKRRAVTMSLVRESRTAMLLAKLASVSL